MVEQKDLGLTPEQQRGVRRTTAVLLLIIALMLVFSYVTREVYQGAIFKIETKANKDKPNMGKWH